MANEAAHEAIISMRAALVLLSDEDRALLAMAGEEMARADMAAQFGVPEVTIRVRLYRARQALKAALERVNPKLADRFRGGGESTEEES